MGGDAAKRRDMSNAMLHFAYGSNMHRAVMRRHAPQAQPLGAAELADHRFIITADGYASVEQHRAATVHGVLWRLTPRDRVTLDLWEGISKRLYRPEVLPVQCRGGRRRALIYVGRPGGEGRPKAGYMELVIAAARQWQFPQTYITSLEQWLPRGPLPAGWRSLKAFGQVLGEEP
jgi:hypothetical protein